ncbi:M20 family metallopeptidase [Halomonas sp. H5]|uniref:M20 family metallopeptidase n=1 Tax=Halomonas sp. H5 TaxID=3423910 RepID=UPI003D36482F
MNMKSSSGRERAIQLSLQGIASGEFYSTLERRVRIKTVSQDPGCEASLHSYLTEEIAPELVDMGFCCRLIENPTPGSPPLLIGERIEDESLLTVLTYGHGDVTEGQEGKWSDGADPWEMKLKNGRVYGRGTADNKGQHSINLSALKAVLEARHGRLGYNIKILFEMSEEIGSPGLEEACRKYKNELISDVFLASDGPRIKHDIPTIFLGSRGVVQLKLTLDTENGGRHSGNWGGVITNPAIVICNAISTLVSSEGKILVDFLRAPNIPKEVSDIIKSLPVGGEKGDPEINPNWGESGLSYGERLYGKNTFEVVGISSGRTDKPIGAIPGSAEAICQLRFVRGTNWKVIQKELRAHLDSHGFHDIHIQYKGGYDATRLSPDHPWARFVSKSAKQSIGKELSILPNLGGTIPNHCFSDVLGLPTVWLPHSYPSCNQHAPDEHLIESIVEQGLRITAGVLWDLGEHSPESFK